MTEEVLFMRILRTARWFMLALLLPLIPSTSAHAGVFISVGIAPPPLPVYVQPPCPEPGLMWSPGYWAYDYDAQSYYWVPGTWVPAPYEGALWTPPYWGYEEGMYAFHPGYWGWHVGYYGGVNYGFGYMGVGFVGGEWHEHEFAYNRAVMNVNTTVIHNTYINQTIVQNHTVINNNHIAYAGGPNGIRHNPSPEERMAMREQHLTPTRFQQQHIQQARSERANFFNVNHGRPQTVAVARPLPVAHVAPPPVTSVGARGGMNVQSSRMNGNAEFRNNAAPSVNNGRHPVMGGPAERPQQPQNQVRGNMQPLNRPQPTYQQPQRPQPNYQQQRPAPQYRPAPEQPRYQQPQYRPQPNYQPQQRPQPQYRAAPQYRPEPQYRPAPQPQYRPAPEMRPQPQYRPAPEPRQAPQPRGESRPSGHERR
ncbi:MAG TPA: hypothetical protein VHN81_10860 [Edaphobacter sp.]|nr:hypothetical protein [Edaphobacter sp.]